MQKQISYIERPEVKDPIYELIVGKSGRGWLYPINVPNPADYIHCTDSAAWNKAGEGYGGGTIKFALEDGTVFKLYGGWHSNSNSMLADTGVDLTEENLTRCVLALEVVNTKYPGYTLDEIIYEENEWHVGKFERAKELAKDWANLLGCKVFCYVQSLGGASMGWVHPDTVSN